MGLKWRYWLMSFWVFSLRNDRGVHTDPSMFLRLADQKLPKLTEHSWQSWSGSNRNLIGTLTRMTRWRDDKISRFWWDRQRFLIQISRDCQSWLTSISTNYESGLSHFHWGTNQEWSMYDGMYMYVHHHVPPTHLCAPPPAGPRYTDEVPHGIARHGTAWHVGHSMALDVLVWHRMTSQSAS